jgi:hypothetical protein
MLFIDVAVELLFCASGASDDLSFKLDVNRPKRLGAAGNTS